MSDAIVKKVQQEWIESCSKIISKAQGCPAQLNTGQIPLKKHGCRTHVLIF